MFLLFEGSASAFTGTPLKSAAFGVSQTSTSLSMSTIKAIKAREILDSRGNPTVEVSCIILLKLDYVSKGPQINGFTIILVFSGGYDY